MTNLTTTARITGACYLAMGISGALGFLIIRPTLYFPEDAAQTLRSLTENLALAHLGVALELCTVLTQSLTAIFFYKLLRPFNPAAAFATAALGLANAVAVLASAACMQTALDVVKSSGLASGSDPTSTVQLLFMVSSHFWAAGSIFFGLWIIPMGQVVREADLAPRPLAWFLQMGGIGYIVSALLGHGLPAPPTWLIDGLTLPATIGEFWMLGYLLFRGIRTTAKVPALDS